LHAISTSASSVACTVSPVLTPPRRRDLLCPLYGSCSVPFPPAAGLGGACFASAVPLSPAAAAVLLVILSIPICTRSGSPFWSRSSSCLHFSLLRQVRCPGSIGAQHRVVSAFCCRPAPHTPFQHPHPMTEHRNAVFSASTSHARSLSIPAGMFCCLADHLRSPCWVPVVSPLIATRSVSTSIGLYDCPVADFFAIGLSFGAGCASCAGATLAPACFAAPAC
jgi:hypothetical protein